MNLADHAEEKKRDTKFFLAKITRTWALADISVITDEMRISGADSAKKIERVAEAV
jgi:hypothetical protein